MNKVSGATKVNYSDGYVNVRGLRLHYVDYGGDGEIVVALHGLVQTAHAFDAIAPILVPRVHLLALDLPGRGGSDWGPPGRYNLTQYLMDLHGFVAALGLQRFALIGTSMGGWMAKMYAIVHPGRVTGLVLNDCAFGANLAGVVRVSKRAARAPAEFADMDGATAWFLAHHDGLDRLDEQTLVTWVSHYLTSTPTGGLRFRCDPAIIQLADWRGNLLAARVGSWVPWANASVAWEQVKRLTMPLLLLRGTRSDVVPLDLAEKLVQLLPAATFTEIPGAGHSPTLYEPEAQAALKDFFGVTRALSVNAPFPSRSVESATPEEVTT